jgi:Tfp pilus assembly protein PilN
MRAVNLIPADQRRNTTVAGRSGGAVYIVLTALVLLVALVAAYAFTGRQVNDKRAELARVNAEADRYEADAKRFATYTAFADLRQQRTQTVAALAASRFDWARTLHELARTVPAGLKLSALNGAVSGAGSSGGTSSAASASSTSSTANPSLELQGCVPGGQDGAAALVSSLRRMEGVQRVSLASSEKTSTTSTATTSASSVSGDCSTGSAKFSLTVAFKSPDTATASAATGTTQTTSTGVTP